MLMRLPGFALPAILVAALFACTPHGEYSLFSGSVKDDDVEEAISGRAKNFEPLFAPSNEMTTLLEQGQFQTFYDRYGPF